MKKPFQRHLFLLPSLVFILTQNVISAHAYNPTESTSLNSAYLENTNTERSLHYYNMKGDRIFAPRNSSTTGLQENLWSTLDPTSDHIEGTSTEKTYLDPRFPKAEKEIIVAVIDSGVDINHEDLRGKVWTNTAEIPDNGIDDDQNGFVDDIHGWNFIGNKNGENIDANTLEVTREVARLTIKSQTNSLSPTETIYFKNIKAKLESELTNAKQALKENLSIASAIALLKQHGLIEESIDGIDIVQGNTKEINQAKKLAMRLFFDGNTSEDLKLWIEDSYAKINFGYNVNFDCSQVIGDNPNILNEVGYGNNDVTGPNALHGTHVAGIIAANRENNRGILGQADSVKIMAIRAVPNGDERDKDIANAIVYAVKNGATVINMSFGKEYSPQKFYVDQAVAYAEKHGVILIHAAGNEGKNTETFENNFPNKKLFNNSKHSHEATNWIEVGASHKNKDATLAATFSNWGFSSVDLFAPGVEIDSSIPGNHYRELQGTSMASPEVAGIAALLLGHFPEKSAKDIINAIMNTTNQYPDLMVNLPGTHQKKPTRFSLLSKTGGTINTFNAMEALLP